jgi:hypothetical protein
MAHRRAARGLNPSAKSEAALPPLAMFKALLLAVWHDMLDMNWPGCWRAARPA